MTMKKIIALLLSMAMLLSMASFAGAEALTDGVFNGTGAGLMGNIEVAVTVEGGKIAKVEVTKQAETAAIGGVALPSYCEQVVAKQSLDVDVVATSSNTLKGFKEAVNDALSKAL